MASDLTNFLTDRLKNFVTTPSGPKPGTKQASTVAVAARKGGVGKTTTAVHLAAGLAMFEEKKVLLVDLDPQGHVGSSLGIESDNGQPGLASILDDKQNEVLEVARDTDLDGLQITAPDKQLDDVEKQLSSRIGKEFILEGALEVTSTHFDCIVLDCPPNLGNLTLNALVAADYLLIPTDYSVLSVQGVADLLEAVQVVRQRLRADIDLLGILVTHLDKRTKAINREIEELLTGEFGSALLETRIGVNTAISRAQLQGEPVFSYDPTSRGSRDYKQLVEEVAKRIFP